MSLLETSDNNILIVGSGAIGSLWYSHFHFLGDRRNNCFFYQSPNRKPIKNNIEFTHLNNKKTVIATRTITTQNTLNVDLILICVKSYQLNQAIADIKHLISAHTIVIKTHNGLGALNNKSFEYLQNNVVLDLLTTHGCLKGANNKIIHTGSGVSHLGISFGKPEKKTQNDITHLLQSALPKVNWCDDILLKQWEKLAINCVINPLTALFDIKNGDITLQKFDCIIDELISEIVLIARLKHIVFTPCKLKKTILLVANCTANNSSSMRCDVQQNRKTEVEYINGYIHRLGQEFNILTPKNTELYQQVLAL